MHTKRYFSNEGWKDGPFPIPLPMTGGYPKRLRRRIHFDYATLFTMIVILIFLGLVIGNKLGMLVLP